MDELKHLLIVFAGVLFINAALSAWLWARHRTPLHRDLFGIWVFGILSSGLQGVVQSDRWMVFAFGFGSFSITMLLADLVGRALNLRMRWRAYVLGFLAGLVASAIATALGAPFWIRALPISIGASLSVMDIAVQALRLPRAAVSTTARATILATALLALHQLDYPFLRDNPRYALAGFVLGILTVFAISISAPAMILEHTAGEVQRLNQQLERRVVEAFAAVRAREEFLTIAAHEIRGPITALRLAIQALRRGKSSERGSPRLLDVVQSADRRLAGFVDKLWDFSRIRAGTLELVLEPVDLVEVVREAAQGLRLELERSGSTLSLAAEGSIVGRWDRLRLGQVVTNLLANAIKFGRGRPITLAVSAQAAAAILVVSDGGIGIPATAIEHIFEPFERAVSVEHYGGLGLGLHIVRTIVRGLGGDVEVASEVGAGSTFTVTLPRSLSGNTS